MSAMQEIGTMKTPFQPTDDATILKREKFTVKTLSQNTAHYSGEFSHWNFSHKVRQKVGHCLESAKSPVDDCDGSRQASPKYVEYWRAIQLPGSVSRVRNVMNVLPPKNIAEFLARVYFEFAQTTGFFVQQTWLYEKLEILYEQPGNVTADSTAWICSVILVLAIGTQFAHMESGELAVTTTGDNENGSMERDAGMVLYETATTLMADVITTASVDSVQACLLLAHFTLPLDTHGLAYTYLGLAIKMAIQNGMHRKPKGAELDAWTAETRNRLWWTAFTLERRVSVLHGRPASITAMEMDTRLPQDLPEFRQHGQPFHFGNMMAMIHLTGNLGDIATALTFLKKCPRHLQTTYFDRILLIRERLIAWWSSLPEDVRTLSGSAPHFRANIHLKLNYSLVQIFTGRPFVFQESSTSSSYSCTDNGSHGPSRRAILVADAVEAAFDTIKLLGLVHETKGLARASYTEFSSCRAALLLLLAHALNQNTERLHMAVRRGMRFIRAMSIGNNLSNKSEASLIEMIEMAVRRLHSRARNADSSRETESDRKELQNNYERFKEWTASCVGVGSFAADSSPVSNTSGTGHMDSDIRSSVWHDAGDAMADLMNWTKQMEDHMDTAVSGDILTDIQTDLMGTTTPDISWGDF